MSKYVQFILVILYSFLFVSVTYLFVYLSGQGQVALPDWMVFAIFGGWLVFCFTAVYWYPDCTFFFQQIRKPVLEEEQRLLVCLHEIQKRAKDKTNYKLRVLETPGLNAFATGSRTIVLSKDCLQYFTDEELCALLAHEMGHLRTKDCTAGMAFYFTSLLPAFVARLLPAGWRFSGRKAKAILREGLMFALVVLIVVLYVLSKSAVLYYLMVIVGFVICFWLLDIVFVFLLRLNSRYTEYRQDGFAAAIGFGLPLKQVLLKIIQTNPGMKVDRFFILTRSTHPVIHNRIRRLEKLTGSRN